MHQILIFNKKNSGSNSHNCVAGLAVATAMPHTRIFATSAMPNLIASEKSEAESEVQPHHAGQLRRDDVAAIG